MSTADLSPPDPAATPKTPLWRKLLPLVVIAAALGAFFALGLQRYISLDTLRDNRETLNAFVAEQLVLAIVMFIAAYAAAVAISVPGASLLTIFGGFLFAPAITLFGATGVIVTAATLGATIIFLVAKTALADTLRGKVSGFVGKLKEGFAQGELSYMVVLRLVPLFPFWGINLAAGVLGVKTWKYVVATFFGIIPGSFVYASIGAEAGAIFDAGSELSLAGALARPSVLVPIVGLAVLALIPVVYKALTKKKDAAA